MASTGKHITHIPFRRDLLPRCETDIFPPSGSQGPSQLKWWVSPEIISFWRNMLSAWARWYTKSWPLGPTQGNCDRYYLLQSSLVGWVGWACWAAWQFLSFSAQSCFLPFSYWSLMDFLHTKLCLTVCSQRPQPVKLVHYLEPFCFQFEYFQVLMFSLCWSLLRFWSWR